MFLLLCVQFLLKHNQGKGLIVKVILKPFLNIK